MKILAVLVVAVLACGCAASGQSSYMPGEHYLRSRNPDLLDCPTGSVPICAAVAGGRVGKRYINCRCGSGPL